MQFENKLYNLMHSLEEYDSKSKNIMNELYLNKSIISNDLDVIKSLVDDYDYEKAIDEIKELLKNMSFNTRGDN